MFEKAIENEKSKGGNKYSSKGGSNLDVAAPRDNSNSPEPVFGGGLDRTPSEGALLTGNEADHSREKKPQNRRGRVEQKPLDDIFDGKAPSVIMQSQNVNEDSELGISLIEGLDHHNSRLHTTTEAGEYDGPDDPGYELYEVSEKEFPEVCNLLAKKYGFPEKAIKADATKPQADLKKDKKEKELSLGAQYEEYKKETEEMKEESNPAFGTEEAPSGTASKEKTPNYIYLKPTVKHPENHHDLYPMEFDNTVFDSFSLNVIYDRERTGFEETKDFPIVVGSTIAGRYQVKAFLGSAAFSKAIKCQDLVTNDLVCLKIIENNKDYFDQSIDEIKLLRYINCNGNPDLKNVVKLFDYFYHKEHLFIVTELLKSDLYEFSKICREKNQTYFTIGRLQKITKQILVGLEYIHSIQLIHCDLKPENILIKSKGNSTIKIIDFGSSCFIHDHLSSYIQSRSYRAPEVIIGCKYDYKIDLWSLGCILAELWTGNILFQNESVQGLLASIIGIVGPFSSRMISEGRLVNNFFTRERLIFREVPQDENNTSQNHNTSEGNYTPRYGKTGKIHILVPKRSTLRQHVRCDDHNFVDFLKHLLQIDPLNRPTASEALGHPWLKMHYAE